MVQRTKQLLICVMFLLILLAVSVSAEEIKNENAKQEIKKLLVTYDLDGKKMEVEINLTVKVDGKTYPASEIRVEDSEEKPKQDTKNQVTFNIVKHSPEEVKSDIRTDAKTSRSGFADSVTGMPFVFVEGGCFLMGDAFNEGDRDEKPVHEVCVGDVYMGKHEVTQGEWKKIMGSNPSGFADCGPKCPVNRVSWDDVQSFISRLNQLSGRHYQLPTEAEWEYAARSGGKSEKWAGTNSKSSLSDFSWYAANSTGRPHPVGQKQPNGLGLYDMSGNVWEWCGDRYDATYYKQSPKDDPTGPGRGSSCVLRGGAWYGKPKAIRTSNRLEKNQDAKELYNGFRLVLPVVQEAPEKRQ